MIWQIKDILNGFKERSGFSILTATIISRILSFISYWIALQLIDNTRLGFVIYAFTIVSFIIPFSGLGLHQSLIRFGALAKTVDEKNRMFIYVLKRGTLLSFLLVFLLIALVYIFNDFFLPYRFYLIILSLLIPSSFLIEILKILFRLKYQNRLFAIVEIVYNVLLVTLVLVLSYLYKELGYCIALVITPLATAMLFLTKLNLKSNVTPTRVNLSFWKYGIYASLSNVATQFLSVIDILLIGYLLKDTEMVTTYKYISLIPLSLVFLPRVFLTTDFVYLTENISDKKQTVKYIKNYLILFTLISFFSIVISFLLSKEILLLFDKGFIEFVHTFNTLILGVSGILILRGLYGNLLSAIGKASINYWIALIALLINILLNYYFIPIYGILGAAITSALLMWLTGLLSTLLFYRFYNKL